jgi:Hypothetical protein (DUF2513)
MRHEPDLIRKLLFYFEAMPDYKVEKCPSIDGYAEQDIMYHMLLLAQAELLDHELSRSTTSDRIISVLGFGLTWQGHEFLAAARDDSLWNQAKRKILGAAGGMVFELTKAWLMHEAKQKLSLPD